ncbi:serine/threonine protein phosphatase [Ruficoccus amylovorans]|uniref:Serine/threonine protein phosphatase n=1 Tax=Ruficoccus amylovorans TaxID=1804625 RepID=A0A842HKT0_9BACT|nr:serine/threonine protein phosphatase [Ruficoccus amylovorans]MBC2595751.1 serine/threonine protein phosphatase [Ruficoccus amylovorans]
MHDIKDTKQASVRIAWDGKVHKRYRGPMARQRFENEVRVLRYLEEKGCDFVPKLLHADPEEGDGYIVTTNCGKVVDKIGRDKADALFKELEEKYGVRHDDAFPRNITYNDWTGRFNVIDFEFATILETGEGLTLGEIEENRRETGWENKQ